MTPKFIFVAFLYYGHIDDPGPLYLMGRVIFDVLNPPWKKWPECPMGFNWADA